MYEGEVVWISRMAANRRAYDFPAIGVNLSYFSRSLDRPRMDFFLTWLAGFANLS